MDRKAPARCRPGRRLSRRASSRVEVASFGWARIRRGIAVFDAARLFLECGNGSVVGPGGSLEVTEDGSSACHMSRTAERSCRRTFRCRRQCIRASRARLVLCCQPSHEPDVEGQQVRCKRYASGSSARDGHSMRRGRVRRQMCSSKKGQRTAAGEGRSGERPPASTSGE
jgi:hypothetical protein